MTNNITAAEQRSIESQRSSIMEDLRTGDLDNLRAACERLDRLAESHYGRMFLARTTKLIAAANRLIDQIRGRSITVADEEAATNQIIDRAVEILTDMTKAEPTGRVPGGDRNTDPEISQALLLLSNRQRRISDDVPDAEEDDIDRKLLDLIVRANDPQTKGALLVAEDLQKRYSRTAFNLRPINLELSRGEILGIVGVNASGKTTLLRMLMGDLRPSNGMLRYPSIQRGRKRRDWKQIKRHIAYVSQTLPWWPGRVFDNLRYVASLYGHPQSSIDAFLDMLLERYGLDKFKDASWSQISGGYRTRFEIARALVSNPDILILDEPLAYLDILSQQVVLRQLRQLVENRARPIGVVITSQQLYEIEAIADRLLVLEGGNTLFSGPVGGLGSLVNELIVEFRSTARLADIKKSLLSHPSGRALISSETGYIAVFNRSSLPTKNGQEIDFNDILEFLGNRCPGDLSYARNISTSCRVLFEPRLASYVNRAGITR
jgi:ABC-2 type transport system ATP-binding protein